MPERSRQSCRYLRDTESEEIAQESEAQSKGSVAFFHPVVLNPGFWQGYMVEADEGPESEEFAAASRIEDAVNFYQTVDADIANLFHLDNDVKRHVVVMLKNEAERLSYFDGKFVKSETAEFVFANKLPLVTIFSRETTPSIFDGDVMKHVLLFALSNDTDKVLPTFQEAANLFKVKVIFVYVDMDKEDVGKPV